MLNYHVTPNKCYRSKAVLLGTQANVCLFSKQVIQEMRTGNRIGNSIERGPIPTIRSNEDQKGGKAHWSWVPARRNPVHRSIGTMLSVPRDLVRFSRASNSFPSMLGLLPSPELPMAAKSYTKHFGINKLLGLFLYISPMGCSKEIIWNMTRWIFSPVYKPYY